MLEAGCCGEELRKRIGVDEPHPELVERPAGRRCAAADASLEHRGLRPADRRLRRIGEPVHQRVDRAISGRTDGFAVKRESPDVIP